MLVVAGSVSYLTLEQSWRAVLGSGKGAGTLTLSHRDRNVLLLGMVAHTASQFPSLTPPQWRAPVSILIISLMGNLVLVMMWQRSYITSEFRGTSAAQFM